MNIKMLPLLNPHVELSDLGAVPSSPVHTWKWIRRIKFCAAFPALSIKEQPEDWLELLSV